MKIKDNIDLKELLIGFTEKEDSYELNSLFDEFIIVYKDTRNIFESGYSGLVYDWCVMGLLE